LLEQCVETWKKIRFFSKFGDFLRPNIGFLKVMTAIVTQENGKEDEGRLKKMNLRACNKKMRSCHAWLWF
jgi:hypothetical protein